MESLEGAMEVLTKPLVAGAVAGLVDYTMTNRPVRNSMYFGLAVGAGIFLGDQVYVNYMKKEEGAKEIGERTIQAVTATAGGLGVDRIVNGMSANIGTKALTILGSEIVGEMVHNYSYPSDV